ncbi:MAG: pantoate--beta-alanine ligase [Bacteroidales bacterium]|nr:pantoate--beta-alanine ligase [Bacteroidales bacterium]
MLILRKISETQHQLGAFRSKKMTVGLVPTMGALHSGHLSLIKACSAENDITVVSIFVNPAQFNDSQDFERYPRDFDNDISILRNQECDLVFAPADEEMYPEPDTRVFQFGTIDKEMEGKHRPGHFNGVAQVVSRLFEIIEPDKAYFGQKDFQQLTIIKELVRQFNCPIDIVSCPIIREPDGLAMSSRNQLLNKEQRFAASKINKSLEKAVSLSGTMEIESLKKRIIGEIDSDPLLETEYFEIVDEETLEPVSGWSDNAKNIGCIAVHIGEVRLIDNMKFS